MSTQRLFTLAYMTCRLQRPPAHLEGVIRDLGIEPAFVLNDAAYFSAADETRIADELHKRALANLEREHRARKP